ncbi:MAG: cytochrome P450 [Beijerinckiaceae bacterium]|nr:cytochrome P450 [Beijerinckiaceae bacterium]
MRWPRLYAPQPVIEERGDDFFIPPHPKPLAHDPGLIEIVLRAHRNLLAVWPQKYYRSCIDEFRILRRQVIVVNTPEHVRHVMVTRNANFERKSPQMRRALAPLLGDGLFISDGETWKRRRPLIADVVHKRRMKEFAPTMTQVAEATVRRWDDIGPDREVVMLSEMATLTAEIISRTVFGSALGAEAAGRVIEGFTAYQQGVDSFNLGYFLGSDEGWPIVLGRGRKRAIDVVHGVVDEVVRAHMEGCGEEGSLLDLMIRRKLGEGNDALDAAALRNEAATIFMAGHETTATALTWAWYLLANAPWAEKRLLEEVDSVCGDAPIGLEQVGQLKWCRAVIMETLRLYPPVPLLPRQAREADQIGDVSVQKGALVIISPWLLQRAQDLWDQPNHFAPERFLEGKPINPFAYIPFAVGPRICAGLNFGLDESILCLATLARRFRVEPRTGYRADPFCHLTLRPAEGVPARLIPRAARGDH